MMPPGTLVDSDLAWRSREPSAVFTKAKTALFVLVFALFYIPFVQTYGVRLIPENSDDFPSYYFGARLAFDSRLSPYEASNWRTVPVAYAGDNGKFYPYLYPPPSLLLFRPLTLLDYMTARLAMLLLNHVLIVAISALVLFRILKLGMNQLLSTILVAYTFSFFPVFQTIDKGQTNLVVLLLLVLTWVALKEKRGSLEVAAPLALAVVLKLTPALLLVPIWLGKRRGAVLWTLIVLAALTAVSLAFLPPGTWDSWFLQVGSKGYAQSIGNLNLSTPANQSLNAFVDRAFYGRNVRFEPLFGGAPLWMARMAIYVLSGAVLMVTLAAGYLSRRGGRRDSTDLEITTWVLASFLVAPISWDHHLVLLLPCVFVLLNHLLSSRSPKLAIAGLTIVGLFLALPYPSNAPAFREGLRTLLISMQLYAVCLLWMLSLFALLRFPRAQLPAEPTR